MEFLRQTEVIQWKDGEYQTIKENSVDDEYTYLFIDYLPPRKFSTYPIDLKDFAIGYCLGEGLIKDYNDIESITVDGTNLLISTKLSHDPEEDLEQEGIVQERKGNCEHACVCRLLEYQGVNSDNAGGVRSELKTIERNDSDLKINATQIIEDIKNLTDEARIWQKTAGVHVAQLKYNDNIIIREDVSRHVAVDKVIGYGLLHDFDLSNSYVIYSGRMPADMVIKMTRAGVPILASNAAPANSGYNIAKKGNITLVGFLRGQRCNVYNNQNRIIF